MTISPEQLLIPITGACAALGGVGRTKVYELVNQGELVKVKSAAAASSPPKALPHTWIGSAGPRSASAGDPSPRPAAVLKSPDI